MFDNNPFRDFKEMMKKKLSEEGTYRPDSEEGFDSNSRIAYEAENQELPKKKTKFKKPAPLSPDDDPFSNPKPKSGVTEEKISAFMNMLKNISENKKEVAPGGGGTTRQQDSAISPPIVQTPPGQMGSSDWTKDRDALDREGQQISAKPKKKKTPKAEAPKAEAPKAEAPKPETDEEFINRLDREDRYRN